MLSAPTPEKFVINFPSDSDLVDTDCNCPLPQATKMRDRCFDRIPLSNRGLARQVIFDIDTREVMSRASNDFMIELRCCRDISIRPFEEHQSEKILASLVEENRRWRRSKEIWRDLRIWGPLVILLLHGIVVVEDKWNIGLVVGGAQYLALTSLQKSYRRVDRRSDWRAWRELERRETNWFESLLSL